jgi:hypothetical protein
MTEEFSIGKTFKSGPLGQRDAVHAAVVLVKSEEDIYPGDSLIFTDSNFTTVESVRHPGPDGDYETDDDGERIEVVLQRQAIADPNVTDSYIKKGDLFWAFLIPGMTVGLRHVFEISGAAVKFEDSFESRANSQDSCRGCY